MLTSITFTKMPDIRAAVLNISFKDDSRLTPGYIFLDPYEGEVLPGPYI
jgi:hypothetical protein